MLPWTSCQSHIQSPLLLSLCTPPVIRVGPARHGFAYRLHFVSGVYRCDRRSYWGRLGDRVERAGLGLPGTESAASSYRLGASIALAETARQVGRKKKAGPGRPRRQDPLYDHALKAVMDAAGEVVSFEELLAY